MIRRMLPVLLLLGACVQATSTSFPPEQRQIALQRMRFAVEAVCLNNTTQRTQERAARSVGFTNREVIDGEIVYVNPATLTFLQFAQSPVLGFERPDGQPTSVQGPGCGVGSPAVDVMAANRLIGEILAPRLVEGDSTVAAVVALGENEDRGFGFLFETLAVSVLRLGLVSFTNEATGQETTFNYPVILIVHDR